MTQEVFDNLFEFTGDICVGGIFCANVGEGFAGVCELVLLD